MILRRGDKGRQVAEVQGRLAELGLYPSRWIDGDFGPVTEEAVLAFQALHADLENDGVVGPNTWARLFLDERDFGPAPWMALAEKEIGVTEVPGPVDNERIEEYLRTTTYPVPDRYVDEIFWCSAFVNAIMTWAGHRGTNSAWSQSWLEWGVPVQPRYGAIVVFSYGGGRGHTGFVHEADASGLLVLGGNQADSVNISRFGYGRVVGYRWPS